MKVYIVIKDETDYNGDRTIHGVYASYDLAKATADYEIETARNWCNSMKESDGRDYHWIPQMIIEEKEVEGIV